MRQLLVVLLWCSLWLSALGQNFEKVDRRALQAPPAQEKTLDSLARYLCPPHYTEMQKARSIFRWIGARIRYDVPALRSGNFPSQDAEAVLQRRTAVCDGYSRLFVALGERAGLDVIRVVGHSPFNRLVLGTARGAGDDPGHAWNAVLLGGRWRLCDPTWGAGAVDPDGAFRAEFNDFWFCTPPKYFVFSHFPDEQRWQLLDSPISRAAFEAFPAMRSGFFRYGLKSAQPLRDPLRIDKEARVEMTCPEEVVTMSRLYDASGKLVEGGAFSESPVGLSRTRVRPPRAGKYQLRLYCTRRRQPWEGNLQKSESYEGVLSYEVVATRGDERGFPRSFGSFDRAGAELLQPDAGWLRRGSRQRFRVRVPGAVAVALFAGDELVGKLSNRTGIFEGEYVVPQGSKLQLCVSYSADRRYWGLVEYEIRP